MTKILVAKASKDELNLLIALSLGARIQDGLLDWGGGKEPRYSQRAPRYTESHELMGPIMDEHEIDTYCTQSMSAGAGFRIWEAEITGNLKDRYHFRGYTRLVAAARSIVAQRLGREIEMPDGWEKILPDPEEASKGRPAHQERMR